MTTTTPPRRRSGIARSAGYTVATVSMTGTGVAVVVQVVGAAVRLGRSVHGRPGALC